MRDFNLSHADLALGQRITFDGGGSGMLDGRVAHYQRKFDYKVIRDEPLRPSEVADSLDRWVATIVRISSISNKAVPGGGARRIQDQAAATSGTMTYAVARTSDGDGLALVGEIDERGR